MIKKLQQKFILLAAGSLFLVMLLLMSAINLSYFAQANKTLNRQLNLLVINNGLKNKPDSNPRVSSQTTPNDLDKATQPHTNDSAAQDDSTIATPPSRPNSSAAQDSSIIATPPPRPDSSAKPKADNNDPNAPSSDHLFKLFNRSFSQHDLMRWGIVIFDTEKNITDTILDDFETVDEDELNTQAKQIIEGTKTSGWHHNYKYRVISTSNETRVALLDASSELTSFFTFLAISVIIGLICFVLVLVLIIFGSKKAVRPIADSYSKQKQFITDAGHELKTPLTVISANNELLRSTFGESEWIDSSDNQLQKMTELITNLITLAKLDEENAKIELSDFNLSDALIDTLSSFKSRFEKRRLTLTDNIEENVTIHGDEYKLRQVITILLDNALKYCDEAGSINVSLFTGKNIHLCVSNTCKNVKNLETSQLFERFYKADRSRTNNGSYGLGLSIAKSIATLHGGTISARPEKEDRILFEVIVKR